MIRGLLRLSHSINSSTIVASPVVPTALVALWLVHSCHLIALLWGLLLKLLLA